MPTHRATYFESAAAFRQWLVEHHARATELLVGFHKRHTGTPSLTWAESVDEALCFGWIDGVRKRVDGDRYTIRFTPRRPRSTWSAVNIQRVAALTADKRTHARGLAAFAARTAARSGRYSYEQRPAALPAKYASVFRRRAGAWKFYSAQPPGYRRTTTWWVVSAKLEATRQRRLAQLIAHSANGRRLPGLERPAKK